MSRLPTVRLGDCCLKIGSGATPRGGRDAYRGGATALIRSQNVHNWGFTNDGLAFIDEQQAAELSNVVVEPSDVLLNITGDSVARCCMAPAEVLPARVNQHVLIIRTDPGQLHSRYLRYWMVAPTSQQHLLSLASAGATRNALTRGMVSDLRLDIPPLPEQRAIASVLGALDDKIDLNRRMCQTLEEMARALFKSWFVDFDPVRAKMAGRDPGLPKEIADLFPSRLVESALGPIPEGWRAAVLGEVVENYDAKRVPLSSRERAERRGPFPYYGAASVMDHVDDFLFDGTYVLMGEDGSVVNQDGAPVLQYVWGKFWVNNHAHVLRGANGVGTEQLLLHLKGAKVAPFVTGAVQPKLNQGNMNRIPFVQPPEPVSRAFGETIEPMFAGVRTKTDQSQTLAALRDTLLPKLISGELRVPASLGTMQEVAS